MRGRSRIIRSRTLRSVSIILLWSTTRLSGADGAVLDPVTEVWLARMEATGKILPSSRLTLMIELSSDTYDPALQGVGFSPHFCASTFCTGEAARSALDKILRLPSVRLVQYLGIEEPLRARSEPAPVLVGVVDSGIDWRHQAFWQDPRCPVLRFWDQTAPSPSIRQVGSVPYGVEFGNQELARRRRSERSPNKLSHGTSMAMIAGGDLHTSSNTPAWLREVRGSPTILVNTTGVEAAVWDAIVYILGQAAKMDARVVINISLGKHVGPHDGSDVFTRSIDEILPPTALVVVPSGNDSIRSAAFETRVERANSIPIQIRAPSCRRGDTATFDIEGWYDASAAVTVSLSAGSAASEAVATREIQGWRDGDRRAVVDHRLLNAGGGMRGFRISGQTSCGTAGPGEWQIYLRNPGKDTTVRLWVVSTDHCEVVFPLSPASSISTFAAGKVILSIGAIGVDARSHIAAPTPYSSEGTTADGRWKPDALLPTSIRISRSGPPAGGTSAASAVAARILAQQWRALPLSSAADLHDAIQYRALVPHSGVTWCGPTQYQPVAISSWLRAQPPSGTHGRTQPTPAQKCVVPVSR